jgi:catechol 2,3-dioxygenase-like lactoylglutathione lyase family enzyme
VQVIFAVADLKRSLEFYEHAFGWPRNDRIHYSNYVELIPPDGGTLGLYEREGYAATVGAQPTITENGRVAPAYVYVRVADVRATVAAIEEAGGRPLSPLAVRSWGEEAAWFADPDGNVVALAQSLRG